MSDWKRFSHRDCPVCSGARKDCRQNLSSNLIHCRHSEANPPDYIYRGEDNLGFGLWAYKPDAEAWNDERRREWRESERARKEAEKDRHYSSLSDRERDREVRKIFNQLYLSEKDRAILERRKYLHKDFIFNCVSVSQWQTLKEPVNPALPGVNQWGNRLNNPTDGILIPIINHLGYWVGIRLYDPLAKEDKRRKKYSYLTSASRGITPHNQRGEHYLVVYLPKEVKENIIGFTEGLEFKPAIAAERLGIPIIGASGGNFASSPKALREAREAIEAKLGKCKLVLLPDGGSRTNKNVLSQYEKLHEQTGLDAIANWQQWDDKARGDIDEIEDLNAIAYVAPSKFFTADKSSSLMGDNIKEQLKNTIKRFFSRKRKKPTLATGGGGKVYRFNPALGLPSVETWTRMGRPTIEYEAKYRDSVWLDALLKGYHYILDNSFTGSGKSHAVPELSFLMRQFDELFNKLWYISNEHRNPSIQTIKDRFTDLFPRNENGFKYDEAGKLVKADKDDVDIAIGGNCSRAGLFHKLQGLGYNPNDKEDDKNPICGSCPAEAMCVGRAGNYRYDRREAFESDRIRCALPQLAREYGYGRDVFVIDEAARQLNPVRTIKTRYEGLLLAVDRLRDIMNPLAYTYLDTLIQTIKPLFDNKERYGISNADILSKLPTFEYMDELIEALEATSIDLFEVFKRSDNIDGLTRAERKKYSNVLDYARYEMRKEAYLESLDNLESLPPNALIHLLKAICGSGGVSSRINFKELTLTIADRWYSDIFAAAAGTIFLDATLTREHLAYLLGIDSGEILEIRSALDKPLGNLTIRNIHIDGAKTSALGDHAINRIKAVMGTLGNIPAICHKSYKEILGGAGHWFLDNRGSNIYAGSEAIAFIGSPFPNIGAVQDEYFALMGSLDGFDEYYQSLIQSEQLQALGRQRCQRYAEREFTAYFIGTDIDLSFLTRYGAKVINEHGMMYSPEAGNKHQVFKHHLLMAAKTIAEGGVKITQTLLAAATGKTQGWISATLKEAGVTLTELSEMARKNISFSIEDPNRKTNNLADDPEYLRWMGIDPIELIEEAIGFIASAGWKDYRDLVLNGGIYPEPIRNKLIGWLVALLIIEPGIFADDGGSG